MQTKNHFVKWQHEWVTASGEGKKLLNESKKLTKLSTVNSVVKREKTTCRVFNQNMEVISEASVVRYFQDAPNRHLGNKFSFKKAVSLLDKETRTELWVAYLNNSPKCLTC